jgi:hypothetical protein
MIPYTYGIQFRASISEFTGYSVVLYEQWNRQNQAVDVVHRDREVTQKAQLPPHLDSIQQTS